jgi:hypothetical protein
MPLRRPSKPALQGGSRRVYPPLIGREYNGQDRNRLALRHFFKDVFKRQGIAPQRQMRTMILYARQGEHRHSPAGSTELGQRAIGVPNPKTVDRFPILVIPL